MANLRKTWLLLPLLAACSGPPWTAGQIEEAYRLCRAEIGFPPISVFENSSAGFGTFMCKCEVEFLADRVSHAKFTDGKHVPEVNRALLLGRTSCMIRHRDGER